MWSILLLIVAWLVFDWLCSSALRFCLSRFLCFGVLGFSAGQLVAVGVDLLFDANLVVLGVIGLWFICYLLCGWEFLLWALSLVYGLESGDFAITNGGLPLVFLGVYCVFNGEFCGCEVS